jgi:nucleoside-diphosphate-sugar epimerase
MRVLVIGGTSFMGPRVVRRLAEAGHDVTVFHRGQAGGNLPPQVKEILGDRQRLADYSSDFRRVAPDVLLDMILFNETEARALVETFKGVAGRVVMPSSMDVYRAYGRLLRLEEGAPDAVPYREEGPLREVFYPYRKHAKSTEEKAYNYEKILAERVLMSEPSLPATILRLPAVYGPDDKQHRLFEYLKPMDDGRPFILLPKGKAGWLWSRGFVENVADAIALAVLDERAAGRVYNVGEEDTLTEEAWIRSIARATGWGGEIILLENSELPQPLEDETHYEHHLVSDTSRIRAELGYRERVGREAAIAQTVAWERENPPAEINPQQFDYAAEDAALERLKLKDKSIKA